MAPMMSRLLIANRGEIAVRIARTAHRMGLATVGVYSEADRDSLHVDTVDLAVALGGRTAAESYLRFDAVLGAADRAGADAVHPGYGFLAENADFARAVIAAGLIWVGPDPEHIELLGDKLTAKRMAVEAGVPTTLATVVAPDDIPDDLAMPALVKAAAGGGGRGMRVVQDRGELRDAIVSASREAEAAFGDGTVFVEPWISNGRHIEVQILGDNHGNLVHLGERECSIQRRNQKVIEEAPSVGIDASTRTVLCDGAVALARHVGYRNAGTVEFMVAEDASGAVGITFLEVNTRLQVEHPVTEMVTGLDLVELQLRVAAGEPLGFEQSDVRVSGHAIEARLVAEDPAAGWMPSVGTLSGFEVPDSVRSDSGVRVGSVVSTDYDSLLAKVVSAAERRDQAARSLARALRSADIAGVRTNADCLAAVLEEPDFLSGATTTDYLERHPEVAQAIGPQGDDRVAQLLAAVFSAEGRHRSEDSLWGFVRSGWRNLATVGQRGVWHDSVTDRVEMVEHRCQSTGRFEVLVGDWPEPGEDGAMPTDERRRIRVCVWRDGGGVGGGVEAVELDGVRVRVSVCGPDPEGGYRVGSAAGRSTWVPAARFAQHDADAATGGPVSPLPGSVVSVHVSVGDTVADGDLLVVVEAMKMEHRILARGEAEVTGVLVAAGDRVDAGDVLIALESA